MIGVVGEPARIAGPHIPLGLTFGDPFGQDFARPAALSDAEGKDAGLERIGHAGHRADQRIAIWRIGDRAVDNPRDARLGQKRHPRHGVFDVVFQTVEIVGIQLEREIIRHRIIGRCPMGATVALVGAEIEAVLLLPKIVGGIHIAQKRELFARPFRPCLDLGHLFENHVLVAHHHHRHGAPAVGLEPLAHALGVVSRRVDHIFAADIALFGMDDPFSILAADSGRGGKAQDRRAQITRAFGKRLGQLRGIDIAIGRIIERAFEVVRFDEGIFGLDLVGRKDVDLHPLIEAHALGSLKFLHPLFGMREPDRAGYVIVHRIIDRLAQTAIKFGRIALHIH